LGSLLILEMSLGLPVGNGFGGVVVDGMMVGNRLGFSIDFGNGLGFADLGLGLPISAWWSANLGLSLLFAAW
jgi:hypothetical protein